MHPCPNLGLSESPSLNSFCRAHLPAPYSTHTDFKTIVLFIPPHSCHTLFSVQFFRIYFLRCWLKGQLLQAAYHGSLAHPGHVQYGLGQGLTPHLPDCFRDRNYVEESSPIYFFSCAWLFHLHFDFHTFTIELISPYFQSSFLLASLPVWPLPVVSAHFLKLTSGSFLNPT